MWLLNPFIGHYLRIALSFFKYPMYHNYISRSKVNLSWFSPLDIIGQKEL